MPRSIARRCEGVYSSSGVRSFGTIVITPPADFTSSSCPLLKPARRKAAGGTTTGDLFLRATVMIVIPLGGLFAFSVRGDGLAVKRRRRSRRTNRRGQQSFTIGRVMTSRSTKGGLRVEMQA